LTSRWRGTLDDGGGGVQVLRLLVLAIAAIFRSKALLIAENLCLRQQLVVLPRRHPRPRLSGADRRFPSGSRAARPTSRRDSFVLRNSLA
jgi:hypothetical protein